MHVLDDRIEHQSPASTEGVVEGRRSESADKPAKDDDTGDPARYVAFSIGTHGGKAERRRKVLHLVVGQRDSVHAMLRTITDNGSAHVVPFTYREDARDVARVGSVKSSREGYDERDEEDIAVEHLFGRVGQGLLVDQAAECSAGHVDLYGGWRGARQSVVVP